MAGPTVRLNRTCPSAVADAYSSSSAEPSDSSWIAALRLRPTPDAYGKMPRLKVCL
jgi:hypothetical protein